MAVGPREWAPKEEPAEKTFEFAGLKFDVKRTGKTGWGPEEELYQTLLTAPDGTKYRHTNSVGTMSRYHGTGLLEAAMSALMDIEFVKINPAEYRQILEEIFGLSPVKASRVTAGARFAAQSFDMDRVIDASNRISEELRKIPIIQRQTKRGLEELQKRRQQPSP